MTHLLNRGAALAAAFLLLFTLSLNAQPGTGVNGHNVAFVKYTQNGGGSFMSQDGGIWAEVTTNSSFNFKETGRDEWSVYLRDDDRKLSIQLDLWQKKIYLTPDGEERFILYEISEAGISNAITPDEGSVRASEETLAGYERCASEGDILTFSTPTDVAYGAEGRFVYRSAMTGQVTFNNETFGDPAPGVPKSGFCKEATKVVVDPPTTVNPPVVVNPPTTVNPPVVDNPPADDEEVIEVVVWDMDTAALNSVVSWIRSRVASIQVPYCYRDSYGRGVGSVPSGCANSNLEKDATGGPAGLCYPKCQSGYSGSGPLCWQSCPTNFRDDGAFCRKPDEYGRGVGRIPDKKPCSDWNAAYRDDGTSCWLDTYGRGAGRIPDKKPCSDWNSAYRDDGTSCWLDTYGRGAGYDYFFKDGMANCEKAHGKGNCEMWGAVAYPKCKPGYHNVACCLCEPNGGPGIKVTAFQRYKCRSDEELYGALCYPKCKPGYKAVGCCLCEPNAGPGIKVTAFDRYKCRSGEELNGALCYPKCKPGYHAVGCCVCSYDCPPDFGADIGVSCTKKTYGRGVGELSTCPPHLIRDETGGPAGLCFPRCNNGYHGVGPYCWMDCPPGLTECGAGCAASDFDCGSTTFDQVFSVAIAAANIATLGLSKPATTGLKAGQTSVKVGSKVFVTSSKIGRYSAKAVAALQQVDAGKKTGNKVVKYIKKKLHNPGAVVIETKSWTEDAYSAYQQYEEEFVNTDFVNQTSADIDRELTSRLHPEYVQTVKQYYAKVVLAEFAKNELDGWEIAGYGLLAAGMIDPTGLVDVAAAYAHPVCNTVEPFPGIPAIYLK